MIPVSRSLRLVGAGLLLSSPALASAAVVQIFYDRAEWNAAVNQRFVTETFDGIPSGTTYPSGSSGNTLGLLTLDITGTPSNIIAVQDNWASPYNEGNTTNTLIIDVARPDPTYYFPDASGAVLHFPNLTNAFAADWYDTGRDYPGLTDLDITLNFGTATLRFDDLMMNALGSGFVGFLSDEEFSFVSFDYDPTTIGADTVKNNALFIDNMSIATPVPAALYLFGSGLVGLYSLGRKRRRA